MQIHKKLSDSALSRNTHCQRTFYWSFWLINSKSYDIKRASMPCVEFSTKSRKWYQISNDFSNHKIWAAGSLKTRISWLKSHTGNRWNWVFLVISSPSTPASIEMEHINVKSREKKWNLKRWEHLNFPRLLWGGVKISRQKFYSFNL